MPEPVPAVPGDKVVKALGRAGFTVARISGSHHVMRHPDGRSVVVPVHAAHSRRWQRPSHTRSSALLLPGSWLRAGRSEELGRGVRAELGAEAYPDHMAYQRITIDPGRMRGLPCIRGTRVTVSAVLGQLAAGRSVDEVLADYPYLERADILAALEFAADAVQDHELPLARPA